MRQTIFLISTHYPPKSSNSPRLIWVHRSCKFELSVLHNRATIVVLLLGLVYASGVVLPVVDLRVAAQEINKISTSELTFIVNCLARLYRSCQYFPGVVMPFCRAWIAA